MEDLDAIKVRLTQLEHQLDIQKSSLDVLSGLISSAVAQNQKNMDDLSANVGFFHQEFKNCKKYIDDCLQGMFGKIEVVQKGSVTPEQHNKDFEYLNMAIKENMNSIIDFKATIQAILNKPANCISDLKKTLES